MLETVAYFFDFLSKNDKIYYLTMAVLCIQGLFLIYLFLALFIHRKDRKELVELAISRGVDLEFRYSWKGVELKMGQVRVEAVQLEKKLKDIEQQLVQLEKQQEKEVCSKEERGKWKSNKERETIACKSKIKVVVLLMPHLVKALWENSPEAPLIFI